MKEILILYNPYYQNNVIKEHLKLLIENEKVAFGKIKSKIKSMQHNFQNELLELFDSITHENYLQLFLTDYSSIYVAKVTKVDKDLSQYAPKYYENLEVEYWFLIEDMYEIIRNDFESVRENILSNFTTPNYGNHTYTIYGNNYVYPLIIEQKEKIDYFITDEKFYTNIYKSKEYLEKKEILKNYIFDKYIHKLHPRSIDNIISAEMEYFENKDNPLYDFSSVVIKLSKTMELEIYLFIKNLFEKIMDDELKKINYQVQGLNFYLTDFLSKKPNLGTMKYLLSNPQITNKILSTYQNKQFTNFILKSLPYYITEIQKIRNENVHGDNAEFIEAYELRREVLGVGKNSYLLDLIRFKKFI